ncbi:acetamidase/formamidase family protein [Halomarina litorea]|uniref:acetamidase/formamidase family protein n=1 Tax=Halomarina litorea TaxID=2961595 RepID=UPI0020C24F42|nr:acetamidase/formamidase family protein [Halomarina sp. BCD28]
MSGTPAPDHTLDASDAHVHYEWDNSLDPVLTVDPGEVVEFVCRDAADGAFGPDSTVDDLTSREFPGHPLTGPVAVRGAEPGDVLEVELLDFEHHGWGVTYFYPGDRGMGLLPEEFPEGGMHWWDLDGGVGRFVEGIEVPLDPFPGNLGCAPAETGAHSTTPPRRVGGNLDVKHLTEGATLSLPVECPGALFSIGDCHGAQGDGEVCVTGIEAPMDVTVRFDVRSDRSVEHPEFRTTGPFTPTGRDEPMYGTTGVADDLLEATRLAVSHMVDHLHTDRGLTRAEAYMLCSVAVDCKVSEVVDAPNWVVSAYLPESLFP